MFRFLFIKVLIAKKSNDRIMLGSTWMVNHDIIFDNDERIYGFVEAECGSSDSNFDFFLTENCQKLYDYIFLLISLVLLLLSIIFYLIYKLVKKNKGTRIGFNKISMEEGKRYLKLAHNVINLSEVK